MVKKEVIRDFLVNDRAIDDDEAFQILLENYPDRVVKNRGNRIDIWSEAAWESDCELAYPELVLRKYHECNNVSCYFTGLLACVLSGALYINWAKKQHRTVKEKRELESIKLLNSLDILYN